MAKKKSAAAATDGAAGEEHTAANPPGMPLFFKRPVALDKVLHAKAGLDPATDAKFAKNTNSIAINTLEFIEAAKFYPIVFTSGEGTLPIAIVGLESENYFVDKNGKWREDTYVPAYVRQYPFVLFEAEKEKNFILCVDAQSPHYREEPGKDVVPFFNPDGTPSPMSNQAMEFCTNYFRHHMVTRNFVADLTKHGLLAPYNSSFSTPAGRKLALSGFQMIDETALNKLPDEVILDFRKKGWLPFIYLALASGSNWRRLTSQVKA